MKKVERLGAAMAVALMGAIMAPRPSAAVLQETHAPRIVGVVVDQSNGHPVAGARVVLDDGRETNTGPRGLFSFGAAEPGARTIAAITQGCRAAGGSFRVEPGKDALLRLVLAASAPIMRVSDTERTGHAVKVITGEQLRSMKNASLREAVRRTAPGLLDGGRRASTPGAGDPLLILDGTRIDGAVETVLSAIPADDVVRVEIIAGTSATLEHGDDAANGLIRVFQQRGQETTDPGQSAAACTVDWAAF